MCAAHPAADLGGKKDGGEDLADRRIDTAMARRAPGGETMRARNLHKTNLLDDAGERFHVRLPGQR